MTRPFAISGSGVGSDFLIDVLNELGHGASTLVCVDAGDPRCYSGTGQIIENLGAADIDFRLGATSAAEGDDPTFVSNGLLSYFASNNDEHISYNSGSISDIDALFNATTDVSAVAVFHVNASTDGFSIIAAKWSAAAQYTGIRIGLGGGASGKTQCFYRAAGAAATNALADSADRFAGYGLDCGTDTANCNVVDSDNLSGETKNLSTATSGTNGSNIIIAENTPRFYCGALLGGVQLSIAQLQAIRTRLLGRFTGI